MRKIGIRWEGGRRADYQCPEGSGRKEGREHHVQIICVGD